MYFLVNTLFLGHRIKTKTQTAGDKHIELAHTYCALHTFLKVTDEI